MIVTCANKLTIITTTTALSLGVIGVHKAAAISFQDSFDPGLGGLVAVVFDPVSDNVFIYDDFATNTNRYTRTGTSVSSIPNPGIASNDIDLDFAPSSINIGGNTVPTNTLLVLNSESSSAETLFGVEKSNGNILASQTLVANQMVGGAWSQARGTFFGVDWQADVVREYDLASGTELNSFTVDPNSSGFDIFFGDLEVNQASGNLFLVSSTQNTIRELTPTGTFVQDIDVNPFGISNMSGIAFDDGRGEAWISSTNGTVYHIGDFQSTAAVPFEFSPGLGLMLSAGLMSAYQVKHKFSRN